MSVSNPSVAPASFLGLEAEQCLKERGNYEGPSMMLSWHPVSGLLGKSFLSNYFYLWGRGVCLCVCV
jgi:hypothetical protein